jgi:Uncharacterised nucleotidyltransferase
MTTRPRGVTSNESLREPAVKNHTSESCRHIALLSELMFRGYARDSSALLPDRNILRTESPANEQEFNEFLRLADAHHVTVRALGALKKIPRDGIHAQLEEWCLASLEAEEKRIANAVEWLYAIVQCLQDSGCPVCVIKSLDHWPDLGSDLDLYTSGTPEQVARVMRQKLQAQQEPRSWGDKLANKWNFRVPGLPELVEVHVRYLGQTGEQELMAQRVLERSVTKTVNGRVFPVPAPEERILISTLQRMYRHFYFRLCDMADVAALINSGSVDFAELRRGAELGGIWPGVASFLVIVSGYVKAHGGNTNLPSDVVAASYSPELCVRFRDNFLRVPLGPAAGLYGSQLFTAGRHGDIRAISRLPLLPPLAVSALVASRLTGSDKGIW